MLISWFPLVASPTVIRRRLPRTSRRPGSVARSVFHGELDGVGQRRRAPSSAGLRGRLVRQGTPGRLQRALEFRAPGWRRGGADRLSECRGSLGQENGPERLHFRRSQAGKALERERDASAVSQLLKDLQALRQVRPRFDILPLLAGEGGRRRERVGAIL